MEKHCTVPTHRLRSPYNLVRLNPSSDLLSASFTMYDNMDPNNWEAKQGKARALWRMSSIMRLRGRHEEADFCASKAATAMEELCLGSKEVLVEEDFKGYIHWMDL